MKKRVGIVHRVFEKEDWSSSQCALSPHGVKNANTAATINNAGTSPTAGHTCPIMPPLVWSVDQRLVAHQPPILPVKQLVTVGMRSNRTNRENLP